MERVFVFGTLKKGFPLHERGMHGARYLGAYRTVQRFPMLIAGPWFAPMMLDAPGLGLHVSGELMKSKPQDWFDSMPWNRSASRVTSAG